MKVEIDIQEKYEELKVIIQNHSLNDEVQATMEGLQNKVQKQSLIGYLDDKLVIIKPEEVYMFYAEQGKVIASLKELKYLMKEKLYKLEEDLQSNGFVRISKSVIVNMNHIKSIEASFDGGLVVVMKNKDKEVISRRYVKKVKDALGIGGK